eukprot:gene43554-53249_t
MSRIVTVAVTQMACSWDRAANIANAEKLVRQAAASEGLSLHFVPSSALVRSDIQLLARILRNLLSNAIRYTPSGRVLLGCRRHRQSLSIEVWDSGIGIAEDRLEKIFDPFAQADASMSRRFGGTGLGTTISRQLVELMGGHIRVQSREGEGSVFTVEVPLGRGAQVRQGEQRPVAIPQLPRLRILAADDVAQNLELLEINLKRLGHEVSGVSDGRAAVEAFAAQTFDLVLMDWRMPGLDSLATSQAIQALAGELEVPRILMITAHGSEVLADRQQQGGAPFAGFLTKPVTPMQLASAVQRALGQLEAPRPVALEGPKKRLQGLRLLVVEDNPLNRQVASELLAGEGAEFPGDITWNFEKFLLASDGSVVARFGPRVEVGAGGVLAGVEARRAAFGAEHQVAGGGNEWGTEKQACGEQGLDGGGVTCVAAFWTEHMDRYTPLHSGSLV